ncbi:MAG: AhpC/TSA family protein [Bacteroidales bacterium]|nr:AhpC/TSA family protein [Bacteroidales bacterium]
MTKKVILGTCLAWFLASGPAAAQQYAVEGQAGANVKTVYMYNVQNKTTDSTAVANGKFCFSGDADGKIFAYIMAKGQQVPVVLDGNVRVDLQTLAVGGTPENDRLNEWTARFNEKETEMRKLGKELSRLRSEEVKEEDEAWKTAYKAYEQAEKDLKALVAACCRANTDWRFPALYLIPNWHYFPRQEFIDLCETGNPAYMQTSYANRLRQTIEGWKRQEPGRLFTDLTLSDTLGQVKKLSDYVGKGKYVLVDFWASWCGPCRRAMPELKRTYEQYKDKGLDIVGVSFDTDKKAWTKAINTLGLPWHHLSDLKGWQCVASEVYGIMSIPATMLIGPDGIIVMGNADHDTLQKKLAELMP